MPLETIEVRAVVEISLRLVKLRGARVITYVLLLMWRHYDSVSIIARTFFLLHLDQLHYSWTLVYLSELFLEFVKDRWAVRLIVSSGGALNFLFIDLNVNEVAIIIGLDCCASSSI